MNDVAIKGGAPDLAKEGVFVADTFECLPKRNESSTRFRCGERGTVEPVLVPIDSPYLPVWQGGVLTGIDASARTFVEKRATFPTALEAVHNMERKRIEARSEFTGVLHEATPKWSQGDAYLARWSLPPISPQR